MNRTEHYGLPQWEEQDRILRTDFNAANAAVDAALHALDENTAELLTDTWRKEETLAAATRLLYGLAAGAAPDAAFARLAAALPWTLIQEYRAAGAYTWTAPDLFGGADYKIGVYMVGGGGSGAAASSTYRTASGGASGYGKNVEMTVTPGQQINGVVGGKGSSAGISTYNSSKSGHAGGTTSFNGITALGGGGGRESSGASGGQGSDGSNYLLRASTVPIYGSCSTLSSQDRYGGASQSPRESQNRFDPGMVTLCAGGCAGGSSQNAKQTIMAMPDGTKGGDGAAAYSGTAKGEDATGNGNGGGAAWFCEGSGSAASGAGSPGMILIYAKAV